MGIVREEPDLKTQLVTEICNISRCAIACARQHGGNRSRSPFIDWYLILRVEENAGLDVIRKQYHRLALQLHPDKNKHPKAEVAFKLVSEAYECLSRDAKRAEFNLERQSSRCIECNRGPYASSNARSNHSAATRGFLPLHRLPSPEDRGIHKKPESFHHLRIAPRGNVTTQSLNLDPHLNQLSSNLINLS